MRPPRTLATLGALAATLLVSATAQAQCPAADANEPNDSCATATALTPGLHSGLSLDGALAAGGSNDDFFVVNVPADQLIIVTCLHSAAAGNIDVGLYDAASGSCGSGSGYLATHFVVLDDEEVSWFNNTGAAVDVVIQTTYSIIDASFICNDYSLDIAVIPDPCLAAIDDAFEPNDNCASNVALAPGSYNDLYVSTTDEDYYRVSVNSTDRVVITCTYPTVQTELSIEIYDDPACTTLVNSQNWGGGWIQAIAANATGATKDYYVRVNPIVSGTATCNLYDFDVVTEPDPCLTAVDDAYEPNDVCGSAATLTPGLTSGLFVSAGSEDYYKISVPATDQVVIDQTWTQVLFGANPRMFLYSDSTCSTEVDNGAWGSGSNQVVYGNATGATVDFYLKVSLLDGECVNYDLNVTLQPDPCILTPDDAFEPNDDCLSAVPLGAGMHTGLFARDADPDWYSVTIPAGQLLTIEQTYNPAKEMGIDRYNDTLGCGPFDIDLQAAYGFGLNTQVFPNTLGAPQTVYFRCYLTDDDCNSYDLNVTFAPDPCQLTPDDAFEPNDSCGSGVVLPLGLSSGLFVAEFSLDHYQIDVPAGQVLTIDQTYVGGSTELGITLFDDPSCTTWLYGSSWGGGFNSVTWTNSTALTHTVYIRCETQIGTGYCLNYDLNATLTPDPCQAPGVDDIYEENDDCGSATPVGPADVSWTGLFTSKSDADYFSFTLPDGASVQFDTSFVNANCNIDTFLYDSASVGSFTCGDPFSYLASSAGFDDVESIIWTNSTGSTETYYVKVEVWSDPSNPSCGNYDLDVTYSGGAYAIPFCFGDGTSAGPCPCLNESVVGANEGCVSSIGVGAILTVGGSNSVVADDMAFTVTQARANQTAMLVQGGSEIATPFKDGILCMGTPTERVEPLFLDGNGSATSSSSIVTNGNITVPGITRYYQVWFRDPGGVSPCGNGSNFSQGLRVFWWI
jgi:hypothetical protein